MITSLKNRENKLDVKDIELNLMDIPGIKIMTDRLFSSNVKYSCFLFLYSVYYQEHGGGGLQIGEVICGGSYHLSCSGDHTHRQVTSPTWGPSPSCKQALNGYKQAFISDL